MVTALNCHGRVQLQPLVVALPEGLEMPTASMKCPLLPEDLVLSPNSHRFHLVHQFDELACFLGQGARRV